VSALRCSACGHENRAGAKFCEECGTAHHHSCASCGAELRPSAKFCEECGAAVRGTATDGQVLGSAPRPGAATPAARDPRAYTPRHLAEKILSSRTALEGERKQVTVLFADVKGSMELAESLDPEEWHRILERFFEILSEGVHRFEGTVNQYTGDGIMALFGAPIAHEDHAQRACYAALHLSDALGRYADEVRLEHGLDFSVRMGLSSGEVVVGKIGDDLRMDYTAQGHTVGLAARMEQMADSRKALLAGDTGKLVSGYFQLRDLGEVRVKGLNELVHVFELEGVGHMRTRLEVSQARGFSKFVGRQNEMATLEAALEQAIEGNAQVVGVVADPGTGKSRLCYEFAERCRARGVAVHQAQALAHGRMISFLPVLHLLRSLFGISDEKSSADARRKVAGTILLVDTALEPVLSLFFDFLGIPDPDRRPAPSMDPEARQRQLVGLVQRLMRARSPQETAVLLVEDLHWLDPASEAFLAAIVEAVSGTHVLLVANFRPEFEASWMRRSWYQQLPLVPLGKEAAEELLAELLGSDPSLRSLVSAIRARTGGNPFFVEEIVQSLAESGALAGTRGGYRLARPGEVQVLPETVQAVLGARIDRLLEREKQVLHAAAVVGREFSQTLAARAADLPESEVAAALHHLSASELVFEQALFPEPEYAFKHPLSQEVAYRTQLATRRAGAHRRVADAILERAGAAADAPAALLAHHFAAAGAEQEAMHWSERAARHVRWSDQQATLRFWRRVRELAGRRPDEPAARRTQLRACTAILDLFWRHGDPEGEADATFEEGRAIAQRQGDQWRLANLHLAYGAVLGVQRGDRAGRIEHASEALRLARETRDPRAELFALAQLSLAHLNAARPREALATAEAALAFPEEINRSFPWRPATMARTVRAQSLAEVGNIAEALAEASRALETARGEEDNEGLVSGLAVSAYVAWLAGRLDDALEHARSSIEVGQRGSASFAATLSHVYRHIAAVLIEQGKWAEAIPALESGLPIAGALRRRTMTLLAKVRLEMGDAEGARVLVAEAAALAQAHGVTAVQTHCLFAQILLRTEGPAAREAIDVELARADAIIEETGARAYAPFVLVERAALARSLGDEAGHDRQLREAQRLWLDMGATARAEQVAREIGL
jgi:class 3 adenylate cyclase/tetratricopeptide (TPR) repeat protein